MADKRALEDALDAWMCDCVEKGYHHGLVVGVYKNKRTLVKGAGCIGSERNQIPTAMSRFEIASITKLFTAATLQILCEQGMIHLDARLGEVLSHIPMSPAAGDVTLRQLATHRSGFPYFPLLHHGQKVDPVIISRDFTRNDLCEYLQNPQGMRQSGRFHYSNTGYALLGLLMETITGKSYEELVTAAVLSPLEMASTSVTLTPQQEKSLVQGHSRQGVYASSLDWSGGCMTAAGGLKSTAADLLRFIEANLANNPAPFSVSLQAMHTPQFSGMTALGWMLPGLTDQLLGNRFIRWHSGLTPGYASLMVIDPHDNAGLVILSGRSAPVGFSGKMLMRQLRRLAWF